MAKKEIDPVEGRQGVTGHNVRYVLVLSTIGVVIAFAVIYVAFLLFLGRLRPPSSRRRPAGCGR